MRDATIIGGFGKMGYWFQEFLSHQGYNITIHDLKRRDTKYRYEPSLKQAISDANLVVVSTPISITPGIIKDILTQSGDPLIFDISSIKSPLLPISKLPLCEKKKVVSTHPMFGPTTRKENLIAIICPMKNQKAVEEVQDIYHQGGIQTYSMSFEEHDLLMNYLLGLPHLINHIFAKILRDQHCDITKLSRYAGPSFLSQLDITTRVSSEDPQLYWEILSMNPNTNNLMDILVETANFIQKTMIAKEKQMFLDMMEQNKQITHQMD